MKNDLLGDSEEPENPEKGLMSPEKQEGKKTELYDENLESSEVKHNIYFSNVSKNPFEDYCTKDFQLVDFRCSLRSERIGKEWFRFLEIIGNS